MRVLYIFRNDLRLQDHALLTRALQGASQALFVYCSTASHKRARQFRQHFISGSIKALSQDLKQHGHELLISELSPREFLIQSQLSFERVAMATEPGSEEVRDSQELDQACAERRIEFYTVDVNSLLDISTLPFAISQLPKVFTDFRKIVERDFRVSHLAEEPHLKVRPLSISIANIPETCRVPSEAPFLSLLFEPGASAGLRRLHEFVWGTQALRTYKLTRNGLLNFNDSSKLSPWLSMGSLSPRQVYWAVKDYEEQKEKNESTYWLIFELLWRDYFRFYAQKHGDQLFVLKGPASIAKPMQRDTELFIQWQTGQTSNDFINAHMREFLATGFMSNRGRQNVASYLAKTLQLPWTWGADYFESFLIDYDVASNWGNWSYLAGVGADPRDRLFNPDRQAEMYDPNGEYRRKWLGSS